MSGEGRRFHYPLLGALAGLAFANLLLGLNPHLLAPVAVARLLSGGALLGALPFGLLALLLRGGARPSRTALALSGALCGLLAIGIEGQRELYYLFLINGSRRVLVATSLALALIAAALFACAVRPPRHGGLRRILLAGALLLLVPPLFGRRAPERTPLATPEPLAGRRTRSLLVVGLEGVSWDLLSGWASDGSLPVFARLLREGAGGPLASPEPYVRSALWTTAATGKRPAKHGVVADRGYLTPLGELRLFPRPRGAPFREPVLSGSVPLAGRLRRSRTFWEILAGRGHGVAVVGWPASYPAADGTLLWATEELFAGDPSPAAGRPPEAAREARLLAAAGKTPLDRFLARTLVPSGLPPADRERARPLAGAARDLAVVAAALSAVPPGPTSVSALVLGGLAGPARTFTPAAAPARFWGLPPHDEEARARALRAYYRFLDETLGDLVEREGGDRVICLFAPVGWGPRATAFQLADVLRGREPEAVPDTSPEGFVLLFGQGIRSGVRLTTANVADLAPTFLVLAGEPIARDMDGRVLAEAFDDRFAQNVSVPVVTSFEPEGPQ